MHDELDPIRQELEAGHASAQTLVQLYNAAAHAEQTGDIAALTEARILADRLADVVDPRLRPELERLVDLCSELLKRVQTDTPAAPTTTATNCPNCGHELSGTPVRCRACGELLI